MMLIQIFWEQFILLELSRKYHVKKIIYASSSAVYGETGDYSIQESSIIQPISFYGASKYTPEQYIQLYQKLYGLPYTHLSICQCLRT